MSALTKRTLFVGDLHGCADEFALLLEEMDFTPATDRLLLTGDAFSRGPQPVEVWDLICQTGAVMVLGNHDERLIAQLQRHLKGKPPKSKHSDQERTITALAPYADHLLPWLEALPLYITGDAPEEFILVHAGINPEKGLSGTQHDEFLTLRTWPPTKGIEGPRWHDAYKQEKLVVFGHDAPRGLVVKREAQQRPDIIGLDSGCVYGDSLSGYILEEDRIVQVKSQQQKGKFF
jgi:hypothetical protein